MRQFNDAMPCKYTSLKDLQDRLTGTICRFNDQLVYVNVKNEKRLQLWDVPTRGIIIKEIAPDDPRFDISMLELGYFNYEIGTKQEPKNHVLFVLRHPSKKFKQGTCHSYLMSQNIDGSKDQNFGSSSILSQGFVDSFEGKFPTIDQIPDGGQAAISQSIAVQKDELGLLNIYYRTHKIACKTPDGTVHRLKGEFSWVIDRLLGGLV